MGLIFLLLRMLLLGPVHGIIVTLAILGTKREFRASNPAIIGNLHFGATYVDAKALAVFYFVRTSNDLEQAKGNGLERAVQAKTRGLLAHYGYPKAALLDVHIEIESRENVDKGGGDWQYFH